MPLCQLCEDARGGGEVLRLLVVLPQHVEGGGVVSLQVDLAPQVLLHERRAHLHIDHKVNSLNYGSFLKITLTLIN